MKEEQLLLTAKEKVESTKKEVAAAKEEIETIKAEREVEKTEKKGFIALLFRKVNNKAVSPHHLSFH